MVRENLRVKKNDSVATFGKLKIIKINKEYGHAVLPKELDFEEDKVYDKLFKQF